MSTSLRRITGGHIGTLPLTALRFRSDVVSFETRDLEGVFGTGGGACSLSGSVLDSGVVDRVETECVEPKELILPHVLEELEEGRRVEGKGLDFERGFVGEGGAVVVRVSNGISGAVFVGDPGVAVRLEGDEGG